jgi:hypothetical protein
MSSIGHLGSDAGFEQPGLELADLREEGVSSSCRCGGLEASGGVEGLNDRLADEVLDGVGQIADLPQPLKRRGGWRRRRSAACRPWARPPVWLPHTPQSARPVSR